MGIATELRGRRVINARGYSTKVGGSRPSREVTDAMVEAAGFFVRIEDLQAAAGAAIADAAKPKKKKIAYPNYQPPYQPGGYNPYFNQAYSPEAGVVCYPAQRLCYNNGGAVNGITTPLAG